MTGAAGLAQLERVDRAVDRQRGVIADDVGAHGHREGLLEHVAGRRGNAERRAGRVRRVQGLGHHAVGRRVTAHRVGRVAEVDDVAEVTGQHVVVAGGRHGEGERDALDVAVAVLDPHLDGVGGLHRAPHGVQHVGVVLARLGVVVQQRRAVRVGRVELVAGVELGHLVQGAVAVAAQAPEAARHRLELVGDGQRVGALGVGAGGLDVPAHELVAVALHVAGGGQVGLATRGHLDGNDAGEVVGPLALVAQVEVEEAAVGHVVQAQHRGAVTGHVELVRVGVHGRELAVARLGLVRHTVAVSE